MYLTKKLTKEEIERLLPKTKKVVQTFQEGTDNWDLDIYEILADEDKQIYEMAQSELKSAKKKAPAKKKKAAPKKTAKAITYKPKSKLFIISTANAKNKAYKCGNFIQVIEDAKGERFVRVKLEDGNEQDFPESRVRKSQPVGYKKMIVRKTTKKPTPKPAPKKEEKKASPKPDFSWKNITDPSSLTPVTRKCHEYYAKAKGGEKVSLKDTGNSSNIVTAKEGEYIMFNAQGYATHIKNEEAFKADCAKAKIEDTPAPKETPKPEPKKEEKKPAPKPEPKKEEKKSKKKRSVCTIEHETKIPTVVKHLIGHVSDWHNNKISWQIKAVYRVDDTIIIAKADYKGIKGVLAFVGKNWTYHRMCVETGNLTKADKPTSRAVITSTRIKEMYRLSDFADLECAKIYRELLTCSLKGKCSHEQKSKFDKLAQNCGDYIKTIETNTNLRRAYYDVVRERRKEGENWNAARSRVTKELKKEAAK